MKITNINRYHNNLCHECGYSYNENHTWILKYLRDSQMNGWTRIQSNILCINCLFKLHLKLNDIFQTESLLDGTDENIHAIVLTSKGIPIEVHRHLKAGHRVKAIKAYRDSSPLAPPFNPNSWYRDINGNSQRYHTMSLEEAKAKIDEWSKLIIVDS